jgi:hypothetical protein
MGQNLTDTSIESIKEFVSFYPERTQKQYISAIKIFMIPYYPQLSAYKRGEGAAMLEELDTLSIQYIQDVKTSYMK